MPVAVACPKCKKKYNLPENMLGKPVKCTACQAQFKTPARTAGPTGSGGRPQPQSKVDPRQQAAAKKRQLEMQQRAKELKQLGVDGPLQRAPDVFDGLGQLRGTPDPLGNHMIDDPGFRDVKYTASGEVEVDEDPMATLFENPAVAKPKKNKGSGSGSGKNNKRKRRKREVHPKIKESLDKATMTMLIIGILIAMFFGFFFFSAHHDAKAGLNTINNALADGLDADPMSDEEIDEFASDIAARSRMVYGAGIGVGVVFIALGLGVQYFPITCSLFSLLLYVAFEIVFTLVTFDIFSFTGWIRRILVCGALGSAFKDSLNARSYNKMMEARRLAGKI